MFATIDARARVHRMSARAIGRPMPRRSRG